MKTNIKLISCIIAAVIYSPFTALAQDESYIEETSGAAECRKTHTGGCTAWATSEIEARDGYLFSVQSVKFTDSKSQNCIVVKNGHRYGELQIIDTQFGPLPFAKTVNLRVECQSGSGLGLLNQVFQISWKATVIANRISQN